MKWVSNIQQVWIWISYQSSRFKQDVHYNKNDQVSVQAESTNFAKGRPILDDQIHKFIQTKNSLE